MSSLSRQRPLLSITAAAATLVCGLPGAVFAQSSATGPALADGVASCAKIENGTSRLACYDGLGGRAAPAAPGAMASGQPAPSLWDAPLRSPAGAALPTAPPTALPTATAAADVRPADENCHDARYSTLSRFWELEAGTDCGTFGLRGYRPVSISWVTSDSMNDAPSSPSAGHTASYVDYRPSEMRMQLSVRTKIAQGLLTQGDPERRDSLWFGYTQQSYWQLFNGQISRPFRATDHEPELVYVYPLTLGLGDGWRLRYAGAGLVHQSNGQSLPLSRSWNRVYLMAGLEQNDKFRLQARIWRRLPESAAEDDNPDIVDYIGRGEISAWWNATRDDTLGLTVRTTFKNVDRGSARLEWMRALGRQKDGSPSGLRFHVQLFTGYGDSLIDYNYRRTVISVGLSLLDF